MEKPEFIYPDEFKTKKSTFVHGAYGPGFCVAFHYKFEEPKTVEEILDFVKPHLSGKGMSIYLNEEQKWLNFYFRQFSGLTDVSPKAQFSISEVEVDPLDSDDVEMEDSL